MNTLFLLALVVAVLLILSFADRGKADEPNCEHYPHFGAEFWEER